MPFGQGGGFAGGGGGGGGGAQGAQGAGGAQGAQGASGGAQGAQGAQGTAGAQGATGAQGSPGAQGNAGAQGAIGPQGLQGSQGSTGAQGGIGAQGSQGANGSQGSQGSQGNQGFQGNQGTLGPLTGDVTTSGNAATLVGTTNVENIIRANTLNQMAAPTTSLNLNSQVLLAWLFSLSTITADPNPGVLSTYYRCNYAGNGNFTLPTSSVATGTWIRIKNVANNTITIQGTVDGQANTFTLTQFQAVTVVYNATNWDAI